MKRLIYIYKVNFSVHLITHNTVKAYGMRGIIIPRILSLSCTWSKAAVLGYLI